MAANTDLWGQLAPSAVRAPVAILREQASLLGAKTNRLVEGKVETRVSGTKLFQFFYLVVPPLDDYLYELFQVWHDVSLYPVRIGDPPSIELRNEEEFVRWLGQKLSSPETKSIIGSLLAQATS